MMFIAQHRKDLLEQNPKMRQVDIVKTVSEMWGKLTETERQPFEELSNQDRLRY
jgi:hypothetical protein